MIRGSVFIWAGLGLAVKGGANASFNWCVVMSDNRPLDGIGIKKEISPEHVSWWERNVQCASSWARRHGYGFAYMRPVGSMIPGKQGSDMVAGCPHRVKGILSPWFCKIPAVGYVLLEGIANRRCDNVVFLDTDVQIVNADISLAAYFARARRMSDEALVDDDWQVLFTSDAPHNMQGICSGIFWVRNSPVGCGIMRNWWDARFPDRKFSPGLHDQPPMVRAHNLRAYGAQMRLMPTSRAWRYEDIPKLAPFRHLNSAPDDPLFHHRCMHPSSNCRAIEFDKLPFCAGEKPYDPAHFEFIELVNTSTLFDQFGPGLCEAKSRSGVGSLHMTPMPYVQPKVPSRTNLDGTPSDLPRPCWTPLNHRGKRSVEEWTCFANNETYNFRPATRRLFDLSLYNHEGDMLKVRARELKNIVDIQGIVMSSFDFQGHSHSVNTSLPHELGIRVLTVPFANASAACGKHQVSWCYESYTRNAINAAFLELGGTGNDLVVFGDVDEIPAASALRHILRNPSLFEQYDVIKLNGRMYSYSFRCLRINLQNKQPYQWTKGPIVTTGKILARYGSQTLRTQDMCFQVGLTGTYRNCKLPGNFVHDRILSIQNASFHLSNFFPDEASFRRKQRENSPSPDAYAKEPSSYEVLRSNCLRSPRKPGVEFAKVDPYTTPKPDAVSNAIAAGSSEFSNYL